MGASCIIPNILAYLPSVTFLLQELTKRGASENDFSRYVKGGGNSLKQKLSLI